MLNYPSKNITFVVIVLNDAKDLFSYKAKAAIKSALTILNPPCVNVLFLGAPGCKLLGFES